MGIYEGRRTQTAAGINYYRVGSGPPLVLVHGIGSLWQAWHPLLDGLAPHREVIAIDVPGFGASRRDADGTFPGLVNRVGEFITELGLHRPEIGGWSMGGGIALELARRGAVGPVTAFAPIGFWNGLERRACEQVLSALRLGTQAGVLGRAVFGTPIGASAGTVLWGNPWKVPAAQRNVEFDGLRTSTGWNRALASFHHYDFHPAPVFDTHPITVVWGSRDVILPAGPQSRRARARLPHAHHITLNGAGHSPFWDSPAACVGALLDDRN